MVHERGIGKSSCQGGLGRVRSTWRTSGTCVRYRDADAIVAGSGRLIRDQSDTQTNPGRRAATAPAGTGSRRLWDQRHALVFGEAKNEPRIQEIRGERSGIFGASDELRAGRGG